MLKTEVRKIYLQKRRAISAREQRVWDDLLLIQFQQLALPPVHAVLTYAAMEGKKEVSTDALLGYLEFRNPGMQIAYPVFDQQKGIMNAIRITETTFFEVNNLGISEPENGQAAAPESFDLILVPLLGFDEAGFRVGYGRGVYDRYLKLARPDAIKIGLSYFEPIPKIEDTDEFDIPLNYCITPQEIYEF
ncbi:MAG: 5-formyltetrahydrofolate cyclo-ligase [Niabella sp.]|nr:5-formyltetrahydrofolate cyclo-ligase [Niabella sp.]